MSGTVSVNCNNCGASLDVDEATRFVTCMHCGSKLEIKRSQSSAFTQVLERIDQNTSQAAADLETIRLEQELERLDREWQMKFPGGSTEDSPAAKAGGAAALICFMVVWVVATFAIGSGAGAAGAPPIFSVLAFGMGVFGLIAMGTALIKMLGGQEVAKTFQQKRQALLDQIAQRKSRPR